jgi:hypothetical protein
MSIIAPGTLTKEPELFSDNPPEGFHELTDAKRVVNSITECVNDLYKVKVSNKTINNLYGQEIDALILNDTVRFRGRFSKVTDRPAEKTMSEKMFSLFDRHQPPDCMVQNSEHFVEEIQNNIRELLNYIKLDSRNLYNRSFSRKARNFLRSKTYIEKLRKNLDLQEEILRERFDNAINNNLFQNIALTKEEFSSSYRTDYIFFYDQMCRCLIYLHDIVKNINKIPVRRLTSFLHHLFTALEKSLPENSLAKDSPKEKIDRTVTLTNTERYFNLKKIVVYLQRIVLSYRNIGLINNVEVSNYTFPYNSQPTNTASGTSRRGKKGSRRHLLSATKTRHVGKKVHRGRKTHKR